MWFLIKSTIVLSLTLVVLSFFSTDETRTHGITASGMTDAVVSAGELVHYMTGFCAEKPDVCAKGIDSLTFIGERTREGAKVAMQLIDGKLGTMEDDPEAKSNAPVAVVAKTNAKTPANAANLDDDSVADVIATSTINTASIPAVAMPALPSRVPIPTKRPIGL